MNENDVYFGLNEKKLSISVFKQSDNSLAFFNEENININPISENTDFWILEKQLAQLLQTLKITFNMILII